MMPPLRRAPYMLLLGATLSLAHCASDTTTDTPRSARQAMDGLEVIRWTTTRDTSTLEGLVVGFQKRPVMSSLATERLLQEGFLVSIVDQADMSVLREKLGSSSMEIRTMYGIVPSWRQVFKRTMTTGQVISVNGRGHASSNEILQLAARGWSTPTESGGCFQLEIAASIVPMTNEQDASLARADRPQGTSIHNTGIETCLQANEVFIVLSANQGPLKSGRGPGSELPLPPTVGHFLLGESADLSGQETPLKGVTLLAFVPHMSASIQPTKKPALDPAAYAKPLVNP